ncbi:MULTISPECIES: hypothetical protein [unclassified Bradyrhizobium]|uniref:hypothetical protein n=1 Tax=unclassified Bradyrhizobium TaxID=2631580 RepID=UPI001FFF971A|nr:MULTISPECIES: hypothetical protein [unclassified Bradyrhizobium]
MLILHPPWPSLLPWCVVSIAASATTLSCAVTGDYFSPLLAARANGASNVLQFGWVFVVQYGTGLILEQCPLETGHYPLAAYQAAFAVTVLMPLALLAWFGLPWLQARKGKDRALVTHRPPVGWSSSEAASPETEVAILEADEHGKW